MKKQLLLTVILAALGGTSMGANAAPAQGMLEWTGFVGGVFNSTDIALTGIGGGDIQKGLLNIQNDGLFSSQRGIVVEAHMVDAGTGEAAAELYDGDINWDLASASISHPGYDLKKVLFQLNGDDLVSGSPVSTAVGSHVVSVTTSYAEAVTVSPGDAVQVSAVIMAEPI